MNYRKTTVTSVFGKLRYERAYYHCRHCQRGHFPTDRPLRLEHKRTRAAEELITLAGTVEPFAESAERLLARLAGMRISKSTVQRVTEAAGERLAGMRVEGHTIGPEESWNWHRDSQGKSVAYVGLDATGVPQQGPRKEKTEGRMPWVGAVFNPPPTHHKQRQPMREARYAAGLMSLGQIGRQIRREARAVGLSSADVVIGLSDGGHGLEECLTDAVAGQARDVEFILDFYHATEHLREFLKALWPAEEGRRRRQLDDWCRLLKHSGGEAVLEELRSLDLAGVSATVLEEHRLLTGYLGKNLHRTDYPRYIANGWHIGSGAIESACKSVVATRMKGPGMRWRPRGTTAMCQLRALYKSQRHLWNAFWRCDQAA